ncbi:hypothetical protein [Szabonella alba]|uniref:Uncharacterized protein n=1 Tax=Szabonella alba TaxID=2804194 RepID=A0A8K0Y156_9RHOB|nr:hypothetical protein [Szabonella alba]MBL4917537.1 hypothetical protein [Szabonella alba]
MELLLASYVLLVLGSFGLGSGLAAPGNTARAAGAPAVGQAAQPAAPPAAALTPCDSTVAKAMNAAPLPDSWAELGAEAERALAHFLNADLDWILPAPQQKATTTALETAPVVVEGFSPASDALELTYRPETDGSGAPFAPMIELLDNDSDSGTLIRFNGRPVADLRGVTDLPPEALHLVALA